MSKLIRERVPCWRTGVRECSAAVCGKSESREIELTRAELLCTRQNQMEPDNQRSIRFQRVLSPVFMKKMMMMVMVMMIVVVFVTVRSFRHRQRQRGRWRVCDEGSRQQTGVKSVEFGPRVLHTAQLYDAANSIVRWWLETESRFSLEERSTTRTQNCWCDWQKQSGMW